MGLIDTVTAWIGNQPTITLEQEPARGTGDAALRALIAELREAIPMQRRGGGTRTLDCVLAAKVLEDCGDILVQTFGEPVKSFGQRVKFAPELRERIDSKGGIAKNQCLFLRRFEDGRIAFAALWPWAGCEDVTLKIGLYDEPPT